MPEVLRLVEEAVGGEAGVVAVDRINSPLRIEAPVGRKQCGHRAKAAQGNRDRDARREDLIEVLAVVVEQGIGIDVVRSEQLPKCVLKMIVEQALAEIELRHAEVEVAPGWRRRGA